MRRRIYKKRIHKKKIRRRIKQENIHGEELNTEQYAWYRADIELYMWCRAETKETRSKTMKDEFFASYLKKNSTPLKK